jgi:hypothetical protein
LGFLDFDVVEERLRREDKDEKDLKEKPFQSLEF